MEGSVLSGLCGKMLLTPNGTRTPSRDSRRETALLIMFRRAVAVRAANLVAKTFLSVGKNIYIFSAKFISVQESRKS